MRVWNHPRYVVEGGTFDGVTEGGGGDGESTIGATTDSASQTTRRTNANR